MTRVGEKVTDRDGEKKDKWRGGQSTNQRWVQSDGHRWGQSKSRQSIIRQTVGTGRWMEIPTSNQFSVLNESQGNFIWE